MLLCFAHLWHWERADTNIDTTFLRRCIASLERAIEGIEQYGADDVLHDVYRAACVKEFELVLEQSGKLLRKRLAAYLPATGKPTASTSRICSGTPPGTT